MLHEKISTRPSGRWPAFARLLSQFLFALIMTGVPFLVSCKSHQTATQQPTIPPPVSVPKLIPVAVEGDSAVLKAKLRTDPNGNVQMDVTHQETSKNMSLQASIDPLGNLNVKAKRKPDTVYVKGKDSLIYVPVPGPEKKVEVNVLAKWQKAMIWLGSVVLLIMAFLGLPKLLKLILKLLKRY